MSTAASRVLTRLLTVAFLLLVRSDTLGRADIPVHRHHDLHQAIATANHGVLLASTPQQKDVDTASALLLGSDATAHDGRVQSAPAPTHDSFSLCSYERTTGQAARPPPFQA